MIVKGRCRGNGSQLGRYLLNTLDNDRAEFIAMQGATSNDPRRALLEMSLTSEITGRTDAGLYHMQLSPRTNEADMSFEQKTRSIEITAKAMGLDGHRWALFEHEKDGRTHLHLVFERYNHETGRMWSDKNNYEKHQIAARQMEIEFGWQLTHEKKNVLDRDIKAHITDLWHESDNGREFVQAMHKAGFEVTQGMDKRPYQIIDQYGTVHDLTRQLQGIKQRDVSEYLNSVRRELRPTAEASHDRRQEYERQRPAPVQSDNLRELSDSQDQMTALKISYKQAVKEKEKQPQTVSYSFKIQQTYTQQQPKPEIPPALPHQPEQKTQSDNLPEISEQQDKAAQMLAHYRQRRDDQQKREREQEMKREAQRQTRKTEPEPSITDPAQEMLQRYRKRRQERGQDRDGPEYEY